MSGFFKKGLVYLSTVFTLAAGASSALAEPYHTPDWDPKTGKMVNMPSGIDLMLREENNFARVTAQKDTEWMFVTRAARDGEQDITHEARFHGTPDTNSDAINSGIKGYNKIGAFLEGELCTSFARMGYYPDVAGSEVKVKVEPYAPGEKPPADCLKPSELLGFLR